ncbi:MAG: hypothetical protein HY675_08950 [Chloroflexi bacterium]|nr:hypothetical protein [Chloroflexota bacterium]
MVSESITVYATDWCGDCRRAKQVLDEHGASYDWIDIEADLEAQALVVRLNGGMKSVPTIVFPDGSILTEPSNRELLARLNSPARHGSVVGAVPPSAEGALPGDQDAIAMAVHLDKPGPKMDEKAPEPVDAGASAPSHWKGRTIASGITGSVIASFCCLPTALAIALGLSLSTAATLSQLLAYQRAFQLAGLVFAGLATWWILRRSRSTCGLSARQRERVPLFVLGAFAAGFATLNVAVIPLLERLPWLLAGR